MPFQDTPYENGRDTAPDLTLRRKDGLVCIVSRSRLINEANRRLPVVCEHTFCYHPWGVLRQKLVLAFEEPIADAWNLAVAQPVVSPHLDEFTCRPSWESAGQWHLWCAETAWTKLGRGEKLSDYNAVESGTIPLYFTFMQRGIEGFDWFCGENLDQWHAQLAAIPNIAKFRVAYSPGHEGYQVQLAPLDYWTGSIELKGRLEFDFFMGLPFVHEHVRPLLRSAGLSYGLDRNTADLSHGFEGAGAGPTRKTFLRHERIVHLGACGGRLVRHHDDAPQPDGIFWRDGSYPPYPPDRMQLMDACIRDLHDHGVRVTPYFSLHEWHPDAPGFAEWAGQYKRTIRDDGAILYSYSPNGIFGGQMCLLSGWRDMLKRHIGTVLERHAFDGLYFDWTCALPCLNRAHRPYAHWDIEGFMDLLEWSRERVGEDGILYLHTSLTPFIMADNLATCVLVYEMPRPNRVTPDLFPPVAEFMKTCSRLVVHGGPQSTDPRRHMLYCLLSHVTVDCPAEEFLAAYGLLQRIDFTRYKRFANHLVSPATTPAEQVRTAVYWNEDEALVLLANLSGRRQRCRWALDVERLGWPRQDSRKQRRHNTTLPPLGFRYVRLVRRQDCDTQKVTGAKQRTAVFPQPGPAGHCTRG